MTLKDCQLCEICFKKNESYALRVTITETLVEDRMLEIYIKILQQLETEEVLFVTDHKTKLVKILRLGRLLHHDIFFLFHNFKVYATKLRKVSQPISNMLKCRLLTDSTQPWSLTICQ